MGFGFSDAWFDVVAEEVLAATVHQAHGDPRHIAIVGLSEPYSPELRREFRESYDADVLLYPVEGGDHGLLLTVLESLGGSRPAPAAAPVPVAAGVPARWTHETTEDDRYVPPGDALDRLDRWAADPSVAAIAVTGIGGLGKTALIGHWLKHAGGRSRRPHAGLFAWSFNADRGVSAASRPWPSSPASRPVGAGRSRPRSPRCARGR